MAKEWYENLIGKEIKWTNHKGETCPGIVTGINYHIGYSIQAARDFDGFKKGEYLTCFRGPMSPIKGLGKARKGKHNQINIRAAVKMIRQGYYDCGEHGRITNDPGGSGPSAATCAFAQ